MNSRVSLLLTLLAAGVVMSAVHRKAGHSHRQSADASPFFSPLATDDPVSKSTCVNGRTFRAETFASVSVQVKAFEPQRADKDSKVSDLITEFLQAEYDTDANTDFDEVRSKAQETYDFDGFFDLVTRTKYISTDFDHLRQAVFWLLTNKQHVIESTIPLTTISELAGEIAECATGFVVRDLRVPESNDVYSNVADNGAVYFAQTLFVKCSDESNIEIALHSGSLTAYAQQSVLDDANYDDAALAAALEEPSRNVRKLLFKNLLAYFGLI